jgi:uncharacterized protein YyaL (SSP411 family)
MQPAVAMAEHSVGQHSERVSATVADCPILLRREVTTEAGLSTAPQAYWTVHPLYDTSDDHEELITRPRDLQDNATPSGNAMTTTALLKLAGFTNELRTIDITHQVLAQRQPMMSQSPLGFGQWLQALAYALSKPWEIAIVGKPEAAEIQALLSVVRDGYRPFQVIALGPPGSQSPAVPLLQDRELMNGQAAAYVCRDFTCQSPATKLEALQELLQFQ